MHTNFYRSNQQGDSLTLTNFDDFVNAGFCIDVDVADTLAVTQHRDALGRPLNVPHQLRRTSGDNQVDHLVQTAQILHLLTSAHLVTDTGLLATAATCYDI